MIKRMAILAWICGMLGLAGTIYIFIEIYQKGDEQEGGGRKKDTVAAVKPTAEDTTPAEEAVKKDTVKATDTVKLPVKAADTIVRSAIVVDSGKKVKDSLAAIAAKRIAEKAKEVAAAKAGDLKPVDKRFNQKELKWLLKRIAAAKLKRRMTGNCVQILRTSDGNNKKAAVQVEEYLRNNHFAIAGRETVDAKIKGINISSNGSCIKLIIGTL